MKTLFLLLALLLCFILARDKARSARSLMTHQEKTELLVSPDQYVHHLNRAIMAV